MAVQNTGVRMITDFQERLSPFREGGASSFLLLLLTADIVFVVLHVLSGASAFAPFSTVFSPFSSELFLVNKDEGYAESYQHVKELWIILLIVAISARTKNRGYLGWGLTFTYLLVDDATALHERLGLMLANSLSFTPALGLRAQDFGELAVTAVAAVILLGLVGFYYLRGSAMFRRTSRDLFLLLCAIAFFGVFIDMADVLLGSNSKVLFLLITIEDGGEMLTMSLAAWYVFFLNIREGRAENSLCDIIFESLASRVRLLHGARSARPAVRSAPRSPVEIGQRARHAD